VASDDPVARFKDALAEAEELSQATNEPENVAKLRAQLLTLRQLVTKGPIIEAIIADKSLADRWNQVERLEGGLPT
jgi:hypothetical protein